MGERIFSKYAYGIEAANAHGTIVAATKVLVGADQKPIPPDFKPVFPEDNLGVRVRSSRSEVTGKLVEDSISIARLYFQALPFFLGCGLKGGVVANTTNGVSVWTFTPALNTQNHPDTFTLEAGDDTQAYAMEYGMFKSLKLSGEIDQSGGESAVKLDAAFFARQVDKQNFTSGLSLGSYTSMSAKFARLFDNSAWNTVGTTEVDNTLRGFELEMQFGNHPKFFGSPNLYFDDHGEGFLDVMLTVTLEGNADSIAIYDEWDTRAFRALRLTLPGDVIGNTNTAHSIVADIYGQWESVTPLASESNNNNLTQALFHGLVATNLTDAFACVVTTNTNTV